MMRPLIAQTCYAPVLICAGTCSNWLPIPIYHNEQDTTRSGGVAHAPGHALVTYSRRLEASGARVEALERLLHDAQEPRTYRTVKDPVVQGDGRVHHAADSDRVIDHHGPLDDG